VKCLVELLNKANDKTFQANFQAEAGADYGNKVIFMLRYELRTSL